MKSSLLRLKIIIIIMKSKVKTKRLNKFNKLLKLLRKKEKIYSTLIYEDGEEINIK